MSLVREKVKAIICLGVDNKDHRCSNMMIEVIAYVQMAQRLSEKEILYYCHLLVLVSIYLKAMKIEENNLNKRLKIYRKV
jgi:hypothetical protein